MLNSLPNDTIFDWYSRLKEFADGKINMNRKLNFDLGRAENIVGKGENAWYQQHFQKASYSGLLTLYHLILTFNDAQGEGFGKHCGKGENAGHQHFCSFPQCFLL